MSLLDSFLLEPPADVDVWIAVRSDGLRGSGTQNDPYDGSVRTQPTIRVTSLIRDADPKIAVAQTGNVNHGYVAYDWVTIAGVTGAGAAYYNGTFQVINVTSTSFQYKMAQDPGATAGGSITCQLDPRLFDAWMNRSPSNATIHLGPGVFETRGWGAVAYGWQPKNGQRFLGSGMGVTILKLVGAAVANSKYFVIGNSYFATPFEASDFTADCNLGGQSIAGYEFPPIACAGLFIQGAHTRFRRIQAINFGSLQPYLECFVLWSAGANPDRPEAVDCVIEDCIAENPSINNGAINSIISLFGGERTSDGVMSYHRACAIRNCVVDGLYRKNPVPISGITYAGLVATVTTWLPHNLTNNDWVVISGALENGVASRYFNGSFQVTVVNPFRFTYTMPSPGPSMVPTGDIWAGQFSCHFVGIANLVPQQVSGQWIATLTSATPHFRVPGDIMYVGNVSYFDPGTGTYPASTVLNGVFVVTSVLSPFVLTYTLAAAPETQYPAFGAAYIGATLQAISADTGTSAVVESNRIFNCITAGPYHDTWSSKDLIARNNIFRAVFYGPYQNMGSINFGGDFPPYLHKSGVPLTHNGKTATFTTQYNHGFQVGQAVKIMHASVGGTEINPYNGYFSIDLVPNSNDQFTYQMTRDPGANADAFPPAQTPQYAALWQTRSLSIENNVIELFPAINSWWQPRAISLAHYAGDPDIAATKLYPRVVIRANSIRFADGLSDSPQYPDANAIAIMPVYCGFAIVDENIIDLKPEMAIQPAFNNATSCFNNSDSAGDWIQGVDYTHYTIPYTPVKLDELTTAVADANLLAL